MWWTPTVRLKLVLVFLSTFRQMLSNKRVGQVPARRPPEITLLFSPLRHLACSKCQHWTVGRRIGTAHRSGEEVRRRVCCWRGSNCSLYRHTAVWSAWGRRYCSVASTPFQAQWSLYVPPGLTFSSSTFCPHSVFMCFVWIWEQTAIISLLTDSFV